MQCRPVQSLCQYVHYKEPEQHPDPQPAEGAWQSAGSSNWPHPGPPPSHAGL